VARDEVVSWLRAAALTFPALTNQWSNERALLPDTVAGPRRHLTGFRGSCPRLSAVIYLRRRVRASASSIVPPASASIPRMKRGSTPAAIRGISTTPTDPGGTS
jgi:hypothetical protein